MFLNANKSKIMYHQYFRLMEAPFLLTPDHRYFYSSAVHTRAMDYLNFGLSQGEGFIVITGDVGAGKTILVGHLLSALDREQFLTATIVSTQVTGTDILRMVTEHFGLHQLGLDKATVLGQIHNHLRTMARRGRRALIVVDEAQNLPMSALEELRMLSNLQFGGPPLLQVLLLGQPQFRVRLLSSSLAQLRQRIVATYHLGPLTEGETGLYIRHRLSLAGWANDPSVADDAVNAVFVVTRGVPRVINMLFTRVLLLSYLEQSHAIDAKIVQRVAREIRAELEGPVIHGPEGVTAIPRAQR